MQKLAICKPVLEGDSELAGSHLAHQIRHGTKDETTACDCERKAAVN
jgi:hypothetical protein